MDLYRTSLLILVLPEEPSNILYGDREINLDDSVNFPSDKFNPMARKFEGN